MKFSCEKSILLGAVQAASRTVAARSSIPALEGLLITAEKNRVTVTGYNLATGISASFDASVREEGAAVIGARLFSDIVRRMPDDVLALTVDESLKVDVVSGRSEFTLLALPRADFPELPDVERDTTFTISQNLLASMIRTTIFAISDNENKPVHTGSLFDIRDGFLNLVSVDGYRMAIRKEPVETGSDFHFVVPGTALREVERLAGDSDEPMTIVLGRRHLRFEMEGITLVSRLLEGEFINYEGALPKEKRVSVELNTREFLDAVERVSLIINERLKNPVRCVFEADRVKLRCQTTLGRATDEIPFQSGGGEEVEIGFNNRYLLDALKAVPDESVMIELNTGLHPCLFRPKEGDGYLFMVLPVRMKAED